jgi:DNA-binding CsgD family transcriptional regulator
MSNKHIDYTERQQIETLNNQGISINRIAEILGRSTSTISKEMKLGLRVFTTSSGETIKKYSADEAQLHSEHLRALKKTRLRLSSDVQADIMTWKGEGKSNKEIVLDLQVKYKDNCPSQSTIYRHISKNLNLEKLGEQYYLQGKMISLKLSQNESREEVVSIFEKGAKLGNARCIYCLGDYYQAGVPGVQKDTNKAFKMIETASNLGLAEAQARLGYLFEFGIGCNTNKALAQQAFLLSAINGSVVGMVAYADNIEHGISGQVSLPIARRWYKEAAARGNFMAKIWLENHDEEYFESLGEHVTYSLEEYDYQHVVNLGRHMNLAEAKEALAHHVVAESLSDAEIQEKLDLIRHYGYSLPPLGEFVNSSQLEEGTDDVMPPDKWKLLSKNENPDEDELINQSINQSIKQAGRQAILEMLYREVE